MLNQDYEDLYKFSIEKPEKFWDEIAKDVVWDKPYISALEDKFSSSPKWFVGGEINMCYNCLDKHVEEGHGDEVIVIHESPITGSNQILTYNDLLHSVSLLAGVLVNRCGIKKGDVILLYFPIIPECLISMLACTRIGATYVVVYGGFSVKELAARILHTEPAMIITCNAGPEIGFILKYKEKIDNALKINGWSPKYCLVYNRKNFECASMNDSIDLDWVTEISKAYPQKPVPLNSDHPMFIIYTSGTTGEPKGLVHSTAGNIVHDKYFAKIIFQFKPNETIWAFSDFGWVLGQSLMSYGALLMRTRTILYEGKLIGTPDNLQFTRVLNTYKVSKILCPPTIMRILKKHCTMSELKLNYSRLYSINIGGEVPERQIIDWVSETFKCEVNTGWGQTELGGTVNLSTHSFRDKRNYKNNCSVFLHNPGLNFKIVDRETGIEQPRGTLGRVLLKLPTLPSLACTFHKNHEKYVKSYFERYPGYYDTMDAGIMDENNAVQIKSRDDDIIHVAAARICGSAIEDICLRNSKVIEAVVIPLEDKIKGFVPFAFLVLQQESKRNIIDEIIESVNDIIGEVACFDKAVIIPDVPRTISNKAHRYSLVTMIYGHQFKVPATVLNGHVFHNIYNILKVAGYNPSLPTDL